MATVAQPRQPQAMPSGQLSMKQLQPQPRHRSPPQQLWPQLWPLLLWHQPCRQSPQLLSQCSHWHLQPLAALHQPPPLLLLPWPLVACLQASLASLVPPQAGAQARSSPSRW